MIAGDLFFGDGLNGVVDDGGGVEYISRSWTILGVLGVINVDDARKIVDHLTKVFEFDGKGSE